MKKNKKKQLKMVRRHKRIRAKISGIINIPRLSVFRSNRSIFAQLIDDSEGKTLLSVSTKEVKAPAKTNKTSAALLLGKILAEKAAAKKINKVVFDKGGYKYHGRVKAVADGAREGGLKF
ncbi:MAG: 50S ribosomal protein L18 [Patescibacteria group bacterium]|nr:50S ribosomal protein L18 [Patescibacteria group bacterium]MDD4610504.1 50S ribosomal protein L18 [Patescibacteria group bacterium]